MLWEQLLNALTAGGTYALIALGYTLVFGVLEILNLAHGEVFMLGAFLGLVLFTRTGLPFPLALAGAMLGSAVLGWLLERAALRPLRGRPEVTHLAPLMSTIGASIFLTSLAQQLFGPENTRFPEAIAPRFYELAGLRVSALQVTILGVSFGLMLALHLFLKRTRAGRALRAVAESAETAGLLGIDTTRIVVLTMALASALGGAAGVLVGLQFNAISPTMGLRYGLKGLIAIVVGGMGNVVGAMVGGLLLGAAEVFAAAYVSTDYRDAVAFGILILVLLLRPSGLFGRDEAGRG